MKDNNTITTERTDARGMARLKFNTTTLNRDAPIKVSVVKLYYIQVNYSREPRIEIFFLISYWISYEEGMGGWSRQDSYSSRSSVAEFYSSRSSVY